MLTIEEQGELEKAKAEQILATHPKFSGVETISVELGNDHTGDPAMWVVFHLRPGFEPDTPWIESFSDYSTKTVLGLLESGFQGFPTQGLSLRRDIFAPASWPFTAPT